MYNAYITRIKNIRKHNNADRLLIGECFGNNVIVSLDYKENELGVYFPSDGKLSEKFCEVNNLVRKKDSAGNNIGGYLDPEKRNITALKLRGEKSDGLFMHLDCLATFGDINSLHEGDIISTWNGNLICEKYIPNHNSKLTGNISSVKKARSKAPIAPLFYEHEDTSQLAYNLNSFKKGDHIEITLKMHGTSQRTAYLPVFKGYKKSFIDKLFRKEGKPIYDWGYVSGTRRVVLDNFDGGFYGSNSFREPHSKFFEGKLWKGEEVYYEVVGYTHTCEPIMGSCSNKKLNDSDFIKVYGNVTEFSYGCDAKGIDAPQSEMYVYRMTMTNEDGYTVEYSPDFMRYRCEQMGVKCVPKFVDFIIPDDAENAGEYVKSIAETYYDGPDPIGKVHVREGVVVRIINRPKFAAYKHKNWSFKALSGIISSNITENTNISDDIAQEL